MDIMEPLRCFYSRNCKCLNVEELRQQYLKIIGEKAFQETFHKLLRKDVGVPPLYFAERLSENTKPRFIWNEKTFVIPAPIKSNNTIDKYYWPNAWGKTRIIAETGAGQNRGLLQRFSASWGWNASCIWAKSIFIGKRPT